MDSNGDGTQEAAAPQPAPATSSSTPITDRIGQLRAQAEPTPIMSRLMQLKVAQAFQAAPESKGQAVQGILGNEAMRLQPGRFEAAKDAANSAGPTFRWSPDYSPFEQLGKDVGGMLNGIAKSLQFSQPAGIGRPPTHDELMQSPMMQQSLQALDQVAATSQKLSDLRYGENPNPNVYMQAFDKFTAEKEKEVSADRAVTRELVQKGYWYDHQYGPPPEWATRTEADAPKAKPITNLRDLADQGITAFEDAVIGENPPAPAEWLKAKEQGEVQAEALQRAKNSAVPGVHTPPLSKQDVANLAFEFTQAKAAGREADFDKAHPIISAMLHEEGAMAPMLAAGSGIGMGLEAAGVASAGLRGALEMATLDSADQIARIRSGAQAEYDPIRALTSVGTFAGAAAVSQRAAEWALSRQLKPLVQASGKTAVDEAAAAIPKATPAQVAAMSGQQQELIRRIEAARQVANFVATGSNVVTFNSINAAQSMLEDAHKANLGGELGKTGARTVVDLLLSLVASRAFPAHVGQEKAAEVADKIADVEAETMRRMADEGPPPAASRIETDQQKTGEVWPRSVLSGPETPRGFERAQAALLSDIKNAPSEDFAASLGSPEVLAKYGDAFGLSGEERVALRNTAEQVLTEPGPKQAPERANAGSVERIPWFLSEAATKAATEATRKSETAAQAVGDTSTAAAASTAHEIVDRAGKNGVSSVPPADVAKLANAAVTMRDAAKGPLAPKDHADAAEKVAQVAAGAIAQRNRALDLESKSSGPRSIALRAAAAIDIGEEVQHTLPDGTSAVLSPGGQAAMAAKIRMGKLDTQSGIGVGHVETRKDGTMHVLLNDGSELRVAPPKTAAGETTGASMQWNSIRESFAKLESQGGHALFGSSPAEIAFDRRVESALTEQAHDFFNKATVEKSIRDLLNTMHGIGGEAARELILNALGYGKGPEALRGLELGEDELAPLKHELEQAKTGWENFLRPFKNKAELESVIAELQQRKGRSEAASLWKPEILRRGEEALKPILVVADKIGKKLYELDRLPWAVHQPENGRKLIVMRRDRAAYEESPPPAEAGPLVGGVKFYEENGYLTHAKGNAVIQELQAQDAALRPTSRLGAISRMLRWLTKTNFIGRNLQGEEAFQAGIKASVPKTLDTLFREINGAIEAVGQRHLAETGLLVPVNPEEDGYKVNLAEVEKAKIGLNEAIAGARDLLHAKLAELEKARQVGDRTRMAKLIGEVGIAKQVMTQHLSELFAADSMTSGWKQVSGYQWGPYNGWFIRNDALHALAERSAGTNAWYKMLSSFTGMARILANRYSALRAPLDYWLSNTQGNSQLLGAGPLRGARTFVDAHWQLFKTMFLGQEPTEPTLRSMFSMGKIRSASGPSETFMQGSIERAFKSAQRAAVEGRPGDVLAHLAEAQFHVISSYPERIPTAGPAFRLMAKLTDYSNAAPYYAAVRQMVENKGTMFGRPLSLDEALTRADRLYDFSRMNRVGRNLMNLGLNLVGYSAKVGEALMGPPPKPSFLGAPLPGANALAWMARDPTNLAGKAAYVAYKGYSIAAAVMSSLAPVMFAGWAAHHLFLPQLTSEQLDRAKDDYLDFEGKYGLARTLEKPFLIPHGMGDDGRPKFLDVRPLSWLGAVVDFLTGYAGNNDPSPSRHISPGGAILAKTIFGRPLRDIYSPPQYAADLPQELSQGWPKASIEAAKIVLPGVVARAVDESIKQWRDSEGHGLQVVPWPDSVVKILTGLRSVSGDISEAHAEFLERKDQGRYKAAPPSLEPINPADEKSISALRQEGYTFETSPAYARYLMLQAKRKVDSLKK